MKKNVLWLLIGALLLGMLLGCQSPAQQSEAVPSAAPTAEPTEEPTAAPVDPLAEIAQAEIKAGKHEREDGYKNPFQTHGIDTPLLNVQLMDGDAYSDERLRTLAKAVGSDILTIAEKTGEAPQKRTVYIVWNLLQDRPVLLGDHMICSAEQVEDGTYREALCGVLYDLSIPWKQIGLCEIVFGTPFDGGLKEYYADEAHALTASCAAVYFLPEIAGEEAAEAAKQTAASMTAYLMETGGFEALRKVISTAEILPDWTAKCSIETPIELPTGHERAAIMTAYRDKKPKRLCVLEFDNITLRVNEGAPIETAEELYDFACRLLYGFDLELDRIRTESAVFTETAERLAKEPIVITLSDDPTQSGLSTGSKNEVNLVSPYAVWHELIHALSWTPNAPAWLQEGLAEHFSRSAVSLAVASPETERFSDWFTIDVETEMQEDERAFYETLWRVYHAVRAENPTVPSDLEDEWAFSRAMGLCQLFLPFDPYDSAKDASVAGVRGATVNAQETDGNALSYPEAMVVLEYLFDTYGTDTIIDCILNAKTLSETCGKDYAELYQDMMASLTETYGPLFAEN